MKVWLLQRSEPTPHDDVKSRAFRTGIMAKLLSDAGHEVLWWTSGFNHFTHRHRYGKNFRATVTQRYNIQYLASRGYKKNLSFRRFMSHADVARNFSKIVISEKEPPDIIISSFPTLELTYAGIKYAKGKKVPIIIDIRDLWPDHFVDITPKKLRPLVAFMLIPIKKFTSKVFSQADGIFSLTEPMLEWGLSYAKRKRNKIDRVVPMGYIKNNESEKSKLSSVDTFWNHRGVSSHNSELIVSFVGTLGKSANTDVIIQSAMLTQARRENIKYVICGDGDEINRLYSRCKNLQNIIFTGWIDKEKIEVLLERSDIGLLPYLNSKNYLLNMPNKPSEYLSFGLVLACSLKTGPIISLINEFKCGFSYMNNPEILARELSSYLADTKRLKSHKMNAKVAFAKKLNGVTIYSEMIQYLEQIVLSNN